MYDITLQTTYKVLQPKTTKYTYHNDVSDSIKIEIDTDSIQDVEIIEIEPKIYNMTETRVPNYTKKAIMDYQRRKYASGDEEYRRKMSEKAKRYYQRKKAKKEALEQSMISV
jgi:hypothetical protein